MIDVICQQLGPKQTKTRRFSGGLWAVAMEEEEKMQTRVENPLLLVVPECQHGGEQHCVQVQALQGHTKVEMQHRPCLLLPEIFFIKKRMYIWAVFSCEKFAKSEAEKHYSTFRLYMINIVLPWSN